MQKTKRILLIVSLIYLPNLATASLFEKICNNDKFLTCLGITTEACLQSKENSEKICKKQYPVNIKAEREEYRAAVKNYSMCATREYFKGLGTDRVVFEKCGGLLETMTNEFKNEALKKHNDNLENIRRNESLQYE